AGAVHASLVFGEPGFLSAASGGSELALAPARAHVRGDDPLWDELAASPALGLLALEFTSRRRLRVNGTPRRTPDGLALVVAEAYANCRKHSGRRRRRGARRRGGAPRPAKSGRELDGERRALLVRADTLFVASAHPTRGLDASHRGGEPGFVRVLD